MRNTLRSRGALTDERDRFIETVFTGRAAKFSVIKGGVED